MGVGSGVRDPGSGIWIAGSDIIPATLQLPLNPGTRLGPYEILSLVGAGGMGEVYKARDTRLDRTVAVKIWLKARVPVASRAR